MSRFGAFSIDSPLWKYLGRVADAFILTVLWAVFSLPVITLGASTVALYTVALRMMRDEESSHIAKQFFQAFKDNIKQGMVMSVIVLGVGLLLGYNIKTLYAMTGETAATFMVAMLILSLVFLLIVKFIFPVIARFSNTLGNLFVISIILAVKNLGWTIFMITISVCFIALGVFKFWPLLLFAPGGIALFDSWILNPIFKRYIEDNNIG